MDERGIVIVIGDAGSGKTAAVWSALQQLPKSKYAVIDASIMEAERVSLTHIYTALLYTLQGITPRRNAYLRQLQIREALGTERRRVVLVIDEAHALQRYVLSGIKRVWNLKYAGTSPLLGIILVGQNPLLQKLQQLYELEGRAEIVQMSGLTQDEVVGYINHKAPGIFNKEATQEIAKIARFPLQINETCLRALKTAYYFGDKTVARRDVLAAIGNQTYRWLIYQHNIKYRDVMRRTGLGVATVYRVLNQTGAYSKDAEKRVINEIDKMIREKTGVENVKA